MLVSQAAVTGKGAALATGKTRRTPVRPTRRNFHSGRWAPISSCTLVARSPEGQELPKFSDALRRLGNRAPDATIDGEIIAASALLGAVLVVGLATATDYPLTVDEFNTDDYGPKALAWYTSGFKDRSHFETVEFSLWYYGPWFQMLTAYVQSSDIADRVVVRHVLTFLVGLPVWLRFCRSDVWRSAAGPV